MHLMVFLAVRNLFRIDAAVSIMLHMDLHIVVITATFLVSLKSVQGLLGTERISMLQGYVGPKQLVLPYKP